MELHNNNFYTFIMDFRGGTYTSQVHAESLHSSLKGWVENLRHNMNEIEHLGAKTIQEIEEQVLPFPIDEDPTLLKGLKNVWFFNVTTKKGSGHVLIVKTEKD